MSNHETWKHISEAIRPVTSEAEKSLHKQIIMESYFNGEMPKKQAIHMIRENGLESAR